MTPPSPSPSLPSVIRPMLGAAIDPDADLSTLGLRFPFDASIKYDGIRGIRTSAGIVSRSGKLLPNAYLQDIAVHIPLGLEFEILLHVDAYYGELWQPFHSIQSAVMSERTPSAINQLFHLKVFDYISLASRPYYERRLHASVLVAKAPFTHLTMVQHRRIENLSQLRDYAYEVLGLNHEGVMLYAPDLPYKFGRCTFAEQQVLKLKPFDDAEGTIVGFEEKLTNLNLSVVDPLGFSRRSAHRAGLVPANTLGVLYVKSELFSSIVKIGTGWTADLAQEIWDNQPDWLGKRVKFKYQKHGTQAAPRSAVFLGEAEVN